jgi:hypothetical protein
LALVNHYEKNDNKTGKITQLCQINLLSIDYRTNLKKLLIGICKKSGDFWFQIIWF